MDSIYILRNKMKINLLYLLEETITDSKEMFVTLKYTYDATGRRIKTTLPNNTTRTYIDGVQYSGSALNFISTPHGRIRKVGSDWIWDYFLKDHLGSVRVVLDAPTSSGRTTTYLATMEDSAAAHEDMYFANLDATRADRPYNYPDANPANTKLSKVPGKSKGLSILLKVMAKDTIEISAKAFYNIDNAMPSPNVDIASILGAAIAAITNPAGNVIGETGSQLASDLGAASSQPSVLLPIIRDDTQRQAHPRSGINYTLYNSNFEIVKANTGILLVEDNINTIQTLASDLLVIQEAGFIEIFIDNQAQTPVYYDNFMVTQRSGNSMEVNAYYPYGKIIPGLSLQGFQNEYNAYKYSAKELQTELQLQWLDYHARMLSIRDVPFWMTPDPLCEKYYWISPYMYVAGNPIRYIDPDGRVIVDANGNVIYTQQGGWASNAPVDAMRIGNAMMATRTGREQWNKAVNSHTNIQFEISDRTVYPISGTFRLGQMEPLEGKWDSNNRPVVTDAKIVIFEGSINEMIEIGKSPKAEAYRMNTINNDQRIAAVAGHEIEHLTPENINQQFENRTRGTRHNIELMPDKKEFNILHETGGLNLRPLIPIQIDLEKLRKR